MRISTFRSVGQPVLFIRIGRWSLSFRRHRKIRFCLAFRKEVPGAYTGSLGFFFFTALCQGWHESR